MEGASDQVIAEISNLQTGTCIVSGVSVPITLKVDVEEYR
jgi:hypothetical protein